jgi:hypothetical protein
MIALGFWQPSAAFRVCLWLRADDDIEIVMRGGAN